MAKKKQTTSTGTTTTTVGNTPVSTPKVRNTPQSSSGWRGGRGMGQSVNTAPVEIDPAAQQLANINRLYRQTFQTPIQNTRRIMGNTPDNPTDPTNASYYKNALRTVVDPGGGFATLMGGDPRTERQKNAPDKLQNLMNRQDRSQATLRKVANYAGAQGFSQDDINQAYQTYLKQEAALSQLMPRQYHAPTKQDLLAAVNNYAPQYQAEREAQQQYEQLIPFMAMIRDSMLQTADADYEYMSEKAMQLRDPEKQAQALNNADALYRLKMLQADAIASNPMSNDPRSIASMLGAFNSGQTKNINNLYGGASNLPDNTGTTSPSQAIDDTFIQQVLAGQ